MPRLSIVLFVLAACGTPPVEPEEEPTTGAEAELEPARVEAEPEVPCYDVTVLAGRRAEGYVLTDAAGMFQVVATLDELQAAVRERRLATGGELREVFLASEGLSPAEAQAAQDAIRAAGIEAVPILAPGEPTPDRSCPIEDDGLAGFADVEPQPVGQLARGRVTIGELEAVGGLSVEVVRRILRRHINELKFCYETRLTEQPGLAGDVLIAFTVDGNGTVTRANAVGGDLPDGEVVQCLTAAFLRWPFPSTNDGAELSVRAPLTFAPLPAE